MTAPHSCGAWPRPSPPQAAAAARGARASPHGPFPASPPFPFPRRPREPGCSRGSFWLPSLPAAAPGGGPSALPSRGSSPRGPLRRCVDPLWAPPASPGVSFCPWELPQCCLAASLEPVYKLCGVVLLGARCGSARCTGRLRRKLFCLWFCLNSARMC